MKPNHGDISQLSSSESYKILSETRWAHLGCMNGNEIYVVPISYYFDGKNIIAHSRLGKKIKMMRKNPMVCVQIEKIESYFRWKSVIAWGKYHELKGDEALVAMRRLIQNYQDQDQDFGKRHSDLEIDFAAVFDSAIVFRIELQRVTGRSEGYSAKAMVDLMSGG